MITIFWQNLPIPAIVNFFTLLLKVEILNHLTYDYGQGLICTTTFTISKHCRLGTQRAPQMCSFYVNLPRLWAAPAALPKWPQTSWKTWEMVFCYQNCSDLLLEKIVTVNENNVCKTCGRTWRICQSFRSLNRTIIQTQFSKIFEIEYFLRFLLDFATDRKIKVPI